MARKTVFRKLCTLLAPLGAMALVASCGIISKDFDGVVVVTGRIAPDGDDPIYYNIVNVDPNSNEDVANNRDKVDRGHIDNIVITIISVGDPCAGSTTNPNCNDATIVSGSIHARLSPTGPLPEEQAEAQGQMLCEQVADLEGQQLGSGVAFLTQQGWIPAAGRWDGVPLASGLSFPLELPNDVQSALNELIFKNESGTIDILVCGVGDRGPVRFQFQVEFEFSFTASVP